MTAEVSFTYRKGRRNLLRSNRERDCQSCYRRLDHQGGNGEQTKARW